MRYLHENGNDYGLSDASYPDVRRAPKVSKRNGIQCVANKRVLAIELLIVVAIILIIAAIRNSYLIRSKMAANEASAVLRSAPSTPRKWFTPARKRAECLFGYLAALGDAALLGNCTPGNVQLRRCLPN